MNIITGLTSEPTQTTRVNLPDGTSFTLNLYFRPQQNGWFFDVIWPGSSALPVPFTTTNRRLVTSPNVLRQSLNLIQFGLMVATLENADPTTQNVFVDGTTQVVLLSAADVAAVEKTYFAGL